MKNSFIIITLFFTLISPSVAQPLETLLEELLNSNLELKALETDYLVALEEAPQLSQLPDPEVGLGVYPLPVETRLGAQRFRLSATQMLPWPALRNEKEALAATQAKAINERKSIEQLELVFKLKQAWLQLYEFHKREEILERKIQLLNSKERLALTNIESGKASTVDVISVQLRALEIEQEIKVIQLSKTNPITTINQLLNRSLDNPITIVDSLLFVEMDDNLDVLVVGIKDNHPMLRMLEWQQLGFEQSIAINTLDAKPSFGVGIDYMAIDPRSDANVLNNGRDILQLRVSAKIPIYRQKFHAKEQQENLKIIALDTRRQERFSNLKSNLDMAITEFEIAKVSMELYQQQIELTNSAIRIAQTNYSVEARGFSELLKLEEDLINYDLKILKAIVSSHLAKSKVERLIVN